MKKLISLLFAVLACTMMFGQVSMDLNVIGRVDANPRFTFDGEKPTYNWANSSVYTQLEGQLGERVSFTLVNHWAGSGEELYPFGLTPELYKSTWMSNANTWLDYLYFDFKINKNWSFRIGKDVIALGGLEYEEWDWDCDYDLCSTFWNEIPAYQWGASFAWTNDSENTSFRLQATSSPFSYLKNGSGIARPWAYGIGQYYFLHEGSYGIVDFRNSIGYMDALNYNGKGHAAGVLSVCLGGRINVIEDMLSVGAEGLILHDIDGGISTGHAIANLRYQSSNEKWELMGKFGYECNYHRVELQSGKHRFLAGATAAFFPLKGKKDLRIQGTIAHHPYFDFCNDRNASLSITVGLTYNLPIHIL